MVMMLVQLEIYIQYIYIYIAKLYVYKSIYKLEKVMRTLYFGFIRDIAIPHYLGFCNATCSMVKYFTRNCCQIILVCFAPPCAPYVDV